VTGDVVTDEVVVVDAPMVTPLDDVDDPPRTDHGL
jgi:hypothetical protein